jgi:hypothetical protein
VNVKAGITTTKDKAAREAFAAAYGTEWEGEDTRSDLVNVKAGITTTAAKAAREGFEGAYSDAHAGEDTRSNIVRAKGGFTTTEAAAQREGFAAAYGSEWEGLAPCGTRRVDGVTFGFCTGRDSLDNLQVGSLVPDAGAGRDEVPNVYGSAHEGRDAKDNLQVGSLVPDAGAGRGIGFEGAYGSEWKVAVCAEIIALASKPSTRRPHPTHWLILHRPRLARQLTNG